MTENFSRKPLRVAPRQPTPQQARFIAKYLKCLDATQAARSADYSSKHAASIGCNLLKLPHVAAAIKKAMDARAKRTEVTQDRVVKELARVAFSDVRALLDQAGHPKHPSELDDDTAAQLTVRSAVRPALENVMPSGGLGFGPSSHTTSVAITLRLPLATAWRNGRL